MAYNKIIVSLPWSVYFVGENMMENKLMLNLGRFNQCVEYSSERKNRPVDPDAKIFYCELRDDNNTHINLTELTENRRLESLSKGFFEIPTFLIGKNNEHGVDHLLSLVDLEIMEMIKHTIEKSGGYAKFEDIIVQIKSLQVFEDETIRNGHYVLVELGIAVVIPQVE